MLSLELARRLKLAGLAWEPQKGDQYKELSYERLTQIYDGNPVYEYRVKNSIWLPRLDQLLAEIEKRGWDIDLMHFAKNRDNTEVRDDPSWSCEVNKFLRLRQGDDGSPKLMGTDHEVNVNGPWQEERLNEFFDADSPEEATAQALIWILEQEGAN